MKEIARPEFLMYCRTDYLDTKKVLDWFRDELVGKMAFDLKDATRVYGQPGSMLWSDNEKHLHTHTALLIDIQPIKCQHLNTKISEPHLAGARRCIDCGWHYNPNRTHAGKAAWYDSDAEHEAHEKKEYERLRQKYERET